MKEKNLSIQGGKEFFKKTLKSRGFWIIVFPILLVSGCVQFPKATSDNVDGMARAMSTSIESNSEAWNALDEAQAKIESVKNTLSIQNQTLRKELGL
ncbi:MAG: hypothetical protein PHS54_04100 [Clostridia bacterium]|nr:hypothetical protein [Clostridia bacterium]